MSTGVVAASDSLSANHRRCGLTAENVRDETLVAVSLTDSDAEAKLSCLAGLGDYEVIGHFSHELFRWEAAPTRDRHDRAYRWGMVALRNYLSNLNINLERPRSFEKYREVGKQPGLVNPDEVFDNIYYYSDVPRALIDAGVVASSGVERRALSIIKSRRPTAVSGKE